MSGKMHKRLRRMALLVNRLGPERTYSLEKERSPRGDTTSKLVLTPDCRRKITQQLKHYYASGGVGAVADAVSRMRCNPHTTQSKVLGSNGDSNDNNVSDAAPIDSTGSI